MGLKTDEAEAHPIVVPHGEGGGKAAGMNLPQGGFDVGFVGEVADGDANDALARNGLRP